MRHARREDGPAINASFNRVFGLARQIDDWHWSYCDSSKTPSAVIAVDESGTVCAHYGARPLRVLLDGVKLPGAHVGDVFALHRSDVTGARVFVNVGREFFNRYSQPDRFPVLFGFPGDRSMRLGRAKLDYGRPHPLRVMRLPVNAASIGGSPLARIRRWIQRRTRSFMQTSSMSHQQPSPRELDDLWERSHGRHSASVIRDAQYIDWRYRRRPGVCYEEFRVDRDGLLTAWAVARQMDGLYQWIDIVWDGGHVGDLLELTQKLRRRATELGLASVDFWNHGDDQLCEQLSGLGWSTVPHPLNLHLTMRFAGLPGVPESDSSRFVVTAGDTDLV